jgi:hypothetical protein
MIRTQSTTHEKPETGTLHRPTLNPIPIQPEENVVFEYIPTDQIYPGELFGEDLDIINRMNNVKGCTVLKYGIRHSTVELPYYYCKTCDINRIYQI